MNMLVLWQVLTPLFVILLIGPVLYCLFILTKNLMLFENKKELKKARKSLFVLALLVLFFMLFTLRLWSNFLVINYYDDEDYFAHLTSFIHMQYPTYEKEFLPAAGRYKPTGSPGCSLMASPFSALGAAFDKISKASINQERTRENLFFSYTHLGFTLSTSFYFIAACVLWALYLSRFYSLTTVFFVLLGGIFSIGLGLFVWRRPVFTHSYEFFLQTISLMILLSFIQFENSPLRKINTFLLLYTLGAIFALTIMVRLNNVFLAIIWLFLILLAKFENKDCLVKYKNYLKLGLSFFKQPLFFYFLFCVFIVVFFIFWFMGLANFYNPLNDAGSSADGYLESIGGNVLNFHNPLVYLKRLGHILGGADMGLIFTAPALLLALWGYFQQKSFLKIWLLPILLACLVNLYIIMVWGSHGSSYGYRYLVYTLSPPLMIFFAFFIEILVKKKSYLKLALVFFLIIPSILSQLLFQNAFALKSVPGWFRGYTMSRSFMQFEIYDALINTPDIFFKHLFAPAINFFRYPYLNIKSGEYKLEFFYAIVVLLPFLYLLLVSKMLKPEKH